MKKGIRIRKFMILSLFFILLMPWVFYVAAHFLETNNFRIVSDDVDEEVLDIVLHSIETNTDSWADPAWQNRVSNQVKEMDVDIEILSPSNQTIYQSYSELPPSFTEKQKVTIIQDGEIYGRVIIYPAPSPAISRVVATSLGLLLAFIVVGYLVRHMIIKPLEKLGQSARQIAEEDLDVQLPTSQIAEIVEVRDGFQTMVDGLKEAFQKQRELEAERRFVIAAVAHDLRTPLFALRGYLDGLEQGIADTPEKRAKYIAVCKEKSSQLDRLVKDLFTFTRTENVQTELNELLDFTEVLRRAMDSLSPQAEQKHISILAEHEKDCIVLGNAHLLERAMSNLLENAIRHAPTYGKVLLSCSKDNDRITFSVQDTGPGFTSEELPRVFEPLFRGEESRNRSTGGAGLGLTISQRIIKLHGGDLVAGNHLEGGASLSGWVPVTENL